ncbi:MAG: site-specific integrase [Bacteroidia bacterium]
MVSTKIIFRTDKKNSLGEHPLYLRIIKNRKSKYISLGQYLKSEYWDDAKKRVKKSHRNSQRLNNFIAQKVADAEGVALEMQTTDKYTTPQQVKDQILGHSSVSFFTFADRVLLDKKMNGAVGTYGNYKCLIKKIKKFTNGRDLILDEITVNWLKNFEIYLRTECENKTNTIHKDLKNVRKIIYEAISEEIFPYAKNPFLRYKLKSESTTKNYLTDEELCSLESLLITPNSSKELSRNLFVFASYAAGLRVSDLLQLRWKNFDGEKIIQQTQKTSSLVSIKLPVKAIEIINYYKPENINDDSFIFPGLDNGLDCSDKIAVHKAIQKANQTINSNLQKLAVDAEISKHIHIHCSRHSFAVRALQKGMRIEYVSKLMGHKAISTTQIYAKIVNEELDKAMEVFN